MHGLPSGFPVALVVPQIGQLLRNTPSLGTTFNTVLMRLSCLVLRCQHAGSLAGSTCVRLWPKPTSGCRHERPCFWASSCRKMEWLCRHTEQTPSIHSPTLHPLAQLLLCMAFSPSLQQQFISAPASSCDSKGSSRVWTIRLQAGTVLDVFVFIGLFSNTRNACHCYGWEWAHFRGENTES